MCSAGEDIPCAQHTQLLGVYGASAVLQSTVGRVGDQVQQEEAGRDHRAAGVVREEGALAGAAEQLQCAQGKYRDVMLLFVLCE